MKQNFSLCFILQYLAENLPSAAMASTENQATRLAALMEQKRVTPRDVAAGIQNAVTHTRIWNYANDPKAKIKPPVLEAIARYLNTTPQYIRDGVPASRKPFNHMPPRQIITDNLGREVVLQVPLPAFAGYIQHVGEESYLGELKAYSLPGFEQGTFRMFQVKGDSMEPVLREGDWVVGAHVEEPASIKNGHIYVIVTNDGICVKRVTNQVDTRGVLVIQSDNTAYTPDVIFAEDVREMWEFKMLLTSNI
jgi:hypothetical protein